MDTRTALTVESWTLYALGVCLILQRVASRLVTLKSPSKLQLDDWIMLFVLVPFTGTVVCATQALTDGNEAKAARALKMRFALEELQIMTNWSVKACLLILYRRICPASTSRDERRLLACSAGYCLLSFLVAQMLLPIWCRPVSDYWSLSPRHEQCTTYYNHSITMLVLSGTTTIVTLILPVPFIPTPRRFLLVSLFLLGIFTLIAGILARTYTLNSPTSSLFLSWSVAETTLLIIFANLPFLSSLITHTAPPRIRQMSSHLSLPPWPRSIKDFSLVHQSRERLPSNATTVSFPPSPTRARFSALDAAAAPLEMDDTWSDTSTPMTPVRKLTLDDPPPELEQYWSSARASVREPDVEKTVLYQEAQAAVP